MGLKYNSNDLFCYIIIGSNKKINVKTFNKEGFFAAQTREVFKNQSEDAINLVECSVCLLWTKKK